MKRLTNVMHLFLLLIMAIIIVPSITFSQGNSNGNSNSNNNANVNALKWETQGNNADTSHFIGTTNQTALKMRTNNQERMRITPDGRIGLGISNPLERFELQGNLKLTGDIIFSSYADTVDTDDKILMVDEDGRTKTFTKSNLTQFITDTDCFQYTNGVSSPAPTWGVKPAVGASFGVLYTGETCPVRVGIGTSSPKQQLHVTQRAVFGQRIGVGNIDPQARIHITTNLSNPNEKLFLIERQSGTAAPHAVFQVTNDGLVRSREVKVDMEVWPDYVFAKEYELMPLKNVKTYIEQNGHLPNVPAASEIETDGLNLGETAKITMEKVEELTLYLIQQQEQLDEQKALIDEQRKLIEAQQRALEEMKKR